MLEQRDDVFTGIRYLLKATGAERAIIAVEANKPDAAEHLRAALPDRPAGLGRGAPVKYPQGAEKMLITALLGREVPSGGLPLDVHALCVNVATTAEIGRLLPHGRGIQERVITVTGPGGEAQGQLPHPDRHAAALPARARRRRGRRQPRLPGRTDDGCGGLEPRHPDHQGHLGRHRVHRRRAAERTHSRDVPVHPLRLLRRRLSDLSRTRASSGCWRATRSTQRMAEEFHLMDCFECGCCSFVCPSHIPLVQQFRVAKAAVRKAAAASKAGAA